MTLCVATLILDVNYSGIPGQNELRAGLWFSASPSWSDWRWLLPFAQGALPLLTGLWFVRSLWRERRGAVELSA